MQAQENYRAGAQSAIHEADIVKAVNNFATTIGAPAWAHTTPAEVRKLRVRLGIVMPQLFLYEGPPDAKGRYPLLSPKMSPLEASFVALTMLNMKAFNPDFQFTAAEQAQNQKLDPAVVEANLHQRQRTMFDIIQGKSISLRDVLAAGENLFTDLGIPPSANSARNTSTRGKAHLTGAKGGL